MPIFSKKKRPQASAEGAPRRPNVGAQSSPRIGVLASAKALSEFDPKHLDAASFLGAHPQETRRETLARYLDANVELILVLGSDALIGEVLTLYRRHFSAHQTPLNLAVMAVGSVHTVADALGAKAPTPKNLKKLIEAAEARALRRRQLPLLKVSSSASPASRLGFACGAGLFYTIFEGFHRSGPEAAGQVLAAGSVLRDMAKRLLLSGSAAYQPVQARLTVDGQPFADSFGFWLAGSLETSWFGLNLGEEGARLRSGDSPKELLSQVTQSRLQPGFVRALRAGASGNSAGFKRIHMDGRAGYVLDGELFDPDRPYMLQVQPAEPAVFHTI